MITLRVHKCKLVVVVYGHYVYHDYWNAHRPTAFARKESKRKTYWYYRRILPVIRMHIIQTGLIYDGFSFSRHFWLIWLWKMWAYDMGRHSKAVHARKLKLIISASKTSLVTVRRHGDIRMAIQENMYCSTYNSKEQPMYISRAWMKRVLIVLMIWVNFVNSIIVLLWFRCA